MRSCSTTSCGQFGGGGCLVTLPADGFVLQADAGSPGEVIECRR
jgi:hypothetical protein